MALIKCPECGHMISDKALSCPQCGCPMRSQSQSLHPLQPPPSPKKSKPLVSCIIGLGAYIVLCFIVCNLARSGDTWHDIKSDCGWCYVVNFFVLVCLCPSMRDYIVCAVVNLAVGLIAWGLMEQLMIASAVCIVVTQHALVIIAAIRRSDAINEDRNNDLLTMTRNQSFFCSAMLLLGSILGTILVLQWW